LEGFAFGYADGSAGALGQQARCNALDRAIAQAGGQIGAADKGGAAAQQLFTSQFQATDGLFVKPETDEIGQSFVEWLGKFVGGLAQY